MTKRLCIPLTDLLDQIAPALLDSPTLQLQPQVSADVMEALAPWLAQHYRKLAFYRFPEPEYQEVGQGVVFGLRRSNSGASDEQVAAVRRQAQAALPALEPVRTPLFSLPPPPPLATLTYDPDLMGPAIEGTVWSPPHAKALLTLRGPLVTAQPLLPIQTRHLAQLLVPAC